MSNWPQDTTKGDAMTNKELADRLRKLCLHPSVVQEVQEIADYIDSLPDPTPEPVKDLRWLVERHECLSRELEYHDDPDGLYWAWKDEHGGSSHHTEGQCLKVVRGTVQGMCHERCGSWHWKPRCGRWMAWTGSPVGDSCDTELEAIDALLTEMEEAK